MKRNIWQRSWERFVDWYCGVDEDDLGDFVVSAKGKKSRNNDFDGWGDPEPVYGTAYGILHSEPVWSEVISNQLKSFAIGDKAEVIAIDSNAASMMFRLAIFSKMTDCMSGWHCLFQRAEDEKGLETFRALLFATEETKLLYNDWFNKHFKNLSVTNECLPIITAGDVISGTACEFKGVMNGYGTPNDTLFDEWLWVVENCNGTVKATADCFIFEDDADAVNFKLTHQ